MPELADVNVVVALLYAEHEHHEIARRWFERDREPASVLICRVVQMGALRTLTRRNVMKEEVRTPAEFWAGYEAAMEDDRFAFAEEPSGLEQTWKALCRRLPKGASGNTDTYLAAFALADGHTLVTLDGGFARFPGLSVEILRS